MSLVDRHAIGMLSLVMRALKYMEAIGLAMAAVASAHRLRTGTKPEHAPTGNYV